MGNIIGNIIEDLAKKKETECGANKTPKAIYANHE